MNRKRSRTSAWLFTTILVMAWLGTGVNAETDVFGDEVEPDPALVHIHFISLRDKSESSARVFFRAEEQESPEAGTGFDRIIIKPGTAVGSRRRPNDLALDLFRGKGRQRIPVATLAVRYYRHQQGLWVPKFTLLHEPMVIRQGDRLIPMETPLGSSNLVLEGGNLPNAEGYYTKLSFTQGLGRTYVDSWQLRQQ
ncbi:MAG: hypothetical protein OEZ10_00670 [Gammaproteobacteria bacterium]|nr:hypothetical protein [Gammaproteobacteria bacterium]